jgi:hypothetical protein
MWRVLCSSGKHILTITTASRMTLLVTHNLGEKTTILSNGKTGSCWISEIGHYVAKIKKAHFDHDISGTDEATSNA